MYTLTPVEARERPVLARLMELYLYDFSDFDGSDVDAQGLYGYPYLERYGAEPGRHAYFIRAQGRLAGFVMICGHCHVRREAGAHAVAEFFVMRKYRRRGLGLWAAEEALRRHPGPWELTVHPGNPVGRAFWDRAAAQVAARPPQILEGVAGVYEDGPARVYCFEVEG